MAKLIFEAVLEGAKLGYELWLILDAYMEEP